MVRKRPVAKVIPTPLPLTCVQTTDQIRTKSDGMCTMPTVVTMVRKQSAAKVIPTPLLQTYMCLDHRPDKRQISWCEGRNTTEAVFKEKPGIWEPMLELTYNLPVRYLIGRLRSPEAQFFVPNWGDKVHYRIRLSYRHYHTHTGSWLAYKRNRVTVPLKRTTRMLSLKKAYWTKNSKNEYSPCNTSSPR